jgi:O-antigen/teichoic acid export membrane protein
MATNLASTLTWTFQLYVLSRFFDNSTVGEFGLVVRLVTLPLGILVGSMGQVLLGSMTREDGSGTSSELVRLLPRLAMVSLVVFTIGGALVALLLALFLGSSWSAASSFVMPLIPLVWAKSVSSLATPQFVVWRRQRELMTWTVLSIAPAWVVAVALASSGQSAIVVVLWSSITAAAFLLTMAARVVSIGRAQA